MFSRSTSLPRPRHGFDLLAVLTLLAAGIIIYAQTLGQGFILFDDPGYVVQNPHVNRGLSWEGWRWAWTSLERSNWHPLTWLSLMLDAQFYGLSAGGYHLTNLLLHLLNAVLLYAWLRRATGACWPSLLTAFFFVAHPLHVESVAWVTERKDVLSTTLFLLTLLAYTRYARSGDRRFYWLAAGLFALGLTAKPMLVTLPPLLLLLDFWPLRRLDRGSWKPLLVEKVPFAVLAAASCLVTVIAQRATAMVPLATLTISDRLAAAVSGYGTYLWKTVAPFDLGIYYPYQSLASWWWPGLWAVALTGTTWTVFRLRRSQPFLLVGWGWFLGTLVPVIGVVQVGGQAVADRYTYLPHIGLFIAVFWLGAAWWPRAGTAFRGVVTVALLVAGAGALLLGYRQAGYWRDGATLLEQTVRVAGRPSTKLYRMLGDELVQANQPAKALAAYRQAWRLGESDDALIVPLGTLLLKEDHWDEAARVLAPARSRSDATADTLNNLALAQAHSGREDEAVATYRLCTERFPGFALAHFNWADLAQRKGDLVEAAAQDELGLSLRDDWLPALIRLSWNYGRSTDPATREFALRLAERAMVVSGGHELGSLNTLALAEAANGRWPEAVDAASRALTVAQAPGAPTGAAAVCQARLSEYQQRRLPN